jgi:catechol 2,3-dioxygenase-like lactoylglutathione lyase family enzyme
LLRTDHIVFPVWDAKASLAFYREVMGFQLVDAFSGADWGGHPWLMMFFVAGDGREIVLVGLRGAKRPPGDGLARDMRHLAFSETSIARLEGWRRKLRKAQVEFWEETHGPQRSLYFEDPNGLILEITAPPSRPAKRTSRTALSKARRWIDNRA